MSESMASSRCWLFGDDINTDVLAPGQYLKAPIDTLASHCLESLNPSFASSVQHGDIIVAGRNFGIGSSREQAAQALLLLGICGVVALSYGGIFFRNAINLGLPVFTPLEDSAICDIVDGQQLELNVADAVLINYSTGRQILLKPLPDFLLHMVQNGGLVNVLEKRFKVQSSD